MQVLLLAVVLMVFSGCAGSPDSVSTTSAASQTSPSTSSAPGSAVTTLAPVDNRTPVVIDSDMAGEGIMSILFLLAQEDLDVRAITVSGTGLVHCEAGVEQVLGLLALVGADSVPVACGPEDPVAGFNTFPVSWRNGADAAYGLELPPGENPARLDAPDLIASVISEALTPVVVYADGPQTNLAYALLTDPTIADNVEMAYLMGGAIDVGGNSIRNPTAEWNIWVDPVAADEVLRSGIPITLVTLDATNQVPLHLFHLAPEAFSSITSWVIRV